MKWRTIEVLYSHSAMALQRELMQYIHGRKAIFVYGANATFDIPTTCKRFCVIHILRHGIEYKGYINAYWK